MFDFLNLMEIALFEKPCVDENHTSKKALKGYFFRGYRVFHKSSIASYQLMMFFMKIATCSKCVMMEEKNGAKFDRLVRPFEYFGT